MFKIYGGLLLENLVSKDRFFDLQTRLFKEGLIQGIQLRVAHPFFTPRVNLGDITNIINSLPAGLELFIHCGSENVGVDLGERFDEKRVYTQEKANYGTAWADWNKETLEWSLLIAKIAKSRIIKDDVLAVIHAGYGMTSKDKLSLKKIVPALKAYDPDDLIALENTPRLISRALQERYSPRPINWERKKYWSFGGTSENMKMLIEMLGGRRKCLLDFTHLIVTSQLARALRHPELKMAYNIERAVEEYFALPHSKVCHFAGVPNIPVDIHTFFEAPIPSPIKDALKSMEVVCLEFPWDPVNNLAEIYIETFIENMK